MEAIISNYKNVFKKWGDFQGRASRSEFWYFVLANFIVSILLSAVDRVVLGQSSGGVLASLYALLALLPSLAVAFRRLHDVGKSAWWLLISLIPLVGFIVLIYFYVKDSDAINEYGANPKTII